MRQILTSSKNLGKTTEKITLMCQHTTIGKMLTCVICFHIFASTKKETCSNHSSYQMLMHHQQNLGVIQNIRTSDDYHCHNKTLRNNPTPVFHADVIKGNDFAQTPFQQSIRLPLTFSPGRQRLLRGGKYTTFHHYFLLDAQITSPGSA